MGRQIQGLSQNTSGPASYCLLGWESTAALFDTAKLMYVLRLLMQSHTSAYKRLALDKLAESRFGQNTKGPCAELWKVIVKYNMDGYVKVFLDTGATMSRDRWKRLVTDAVRSRQYRLWRITSMLYKTMSMLIIIITLTRFELRPGKLSLWWLVARVNPQVTRAC